MKANIFNRISTMKKGDAITLTNPTNRDLVQAWSAACALLPYGIEIFLAGANNTLRIERR